MLFTELKEDIKAGARRIYLIEGDDAYFRTKAEEQLKAAFLSMPELNYTVYDGSLYKGAALSDIASAMAVYPFMADRRVIKITDFYPTESDYEKYLKDAFENAPETVLLMIVNAGGKKGADLKKKKCITLVNCNRTDGGTVTKWAYLTMKRAGIASTAEACEVIAAYCLNDMSRVSKEVEKLIEWAKDKGEITKADVDELVYKDGSYRMYELTNALARNDRASFMEILNDLTKKGETASTINSVLSTYSRNLLTAATSPLSDGELATVLGMKEYGVKKLRENADRIGVSRIKKWVTALYEIASNTKSGKYTPSAELELSIAEVFFG